MGIARARCGRCGRAERSAGAGGGRERRVTPPDAAKRGHSAALLGCQSRLEGAQGRRWGRALAWHLGSLDKDGQKQHSAGGRRARDHDGFSRVMDDAPQRPDDVAWTGDGFPRASGQIPRKGGYFPRSHGQPPREYAGRASVRPSRIRGKSSQASGGASSARGSRTRARGALSQARGKAPRPRGEFPTIRGKSSRIRGTGPPHSRRRTLPTTPQAPPCARARPCPAVGSPGRPAGRPASAARRGVSPA